MDPALIFFAALAAFLCYRLYTVLGTKGGHEPSDSENVVPLRPAQNDTDADTPPRGPIVDAKPIPAWAETVRENYPAFEVKPFLEGAKSAYEMIVQSFSSGDLSETRPFIAASVLSAFETAVASRQASGQTMEVTFVGIEKADVQRSFVEDGEVKVVIAFQSDQIRIVRDEDGNVIDGDPNRIDLVKDVWTFSRPTGSNDPNWLLTATDGAAPTNA